MDTHAPGTPLELSSPGDIWLPAVVMRVCACTLVSDFSSLVPWRREEGGRREGDDEGKEDKEEEGEAGMIAQKCMCLRATIVSMSASTSASLSLCI